MAAPGRGGRRGRGTGGLLALAADYERAYPSATAVIQRDLDAPPALPGEHRKRIRSTNLLERTFVEVRRRTKVICSFPSERPRRSGLIWVVLGLSPRGWRGMVMTPRAVAEIERLRPEPATRGLVAILLFAAACVGSGSAAKEVGEGLAKSRTKDDALSALQRWIDEGGDKQTVTFGFCEAVTSLGHEGTLPSGSDWLSALGAEVTGVASEDDLLDELEAGLTIAERTNPQVAMRYFRACSSLN